MIRYRGTLLAGLAMIPILAALPTPTSASPDKPVIALSNAYYGNTWRHQMVEAFEASAKEAKAAKAAKATKAAKAKAAKEEPKKEAE